MRKILSLLLLLPTVGFAQIASADEYLSRREKVLSMLDTTSAIVLKAVSLSPRANEYIQEYNFNYLTGINSAENLLLMSPRGIMVGNRKKNTLIFYADYNEVKNIRLGVNDTLIQNSEFKTVFNNLLPTISKLYYSAPDLILVNDWISDKVYFMEREMKTRLKSAYPKLKVESAEFFVGKLREIKSKQEIEFIRKASEITSDGMIAAMKLAKPGIWEYELQAAIEFEYTRQGAMLRGFASIVGSGLNSLSPHYSENTRQALASELVVIDIGAKFRGYSSDISRTIPVSGKYTDAQKEIYSMVLKVQKEAIAMIKPGVSTDDLEKFAQNAFKSLGYNKYFTHLLSHPVGLDVHDIKTGSILKPGMVITIEPGLYFNPDDEDTPDKYKGFGVRIEDTILVTETGFDILSKNSPKEIDEIETLMKTKRFSR